MGFVHVQPSGEMRPGEQMLELHESSRLFANFSSNPGLDEIRDRTTGALLGHANVERGAAEIAFAGESRRVVRTRGRTIEVEAGDSTGGHQLPRFPAKAAPVSGHLCGVVRQHLGIAPSQVPWLRQQGGEFVYFWFLGSFGAKLASQSLGRTDRSNPLTCSSTKQLSGANFAFSQDHMERAAGAIWADLEQLLEAGAATFLAFVPDEVRRDWVELSARATRLWEWSQSVEVIDPDPVMAAKLRQLL